MNRMNRLHDSATMIDRTGGLTADASVSALPMGENGVIVERISPSLTARGVSLIMARRAVSDSFCPLIGDDLSRCRLRNPTDSAAAVMEMEVVMIVTMGPVIFIGRY